MGNPSLGSFPFLVFQGALAEGAGKKGPTGRELGSRTGNWKGKGVGGLGSSPPPTLPPLPIPSQAGTHSRQGLGAVSWGGGEGAGTVVCLRSEGG